MITTRLFIVLGAICFSTALFSQKEYDFTSSGQQKLLLNPAFTGSTKGFDVQTLYARHPYSDSYYTGISYSGKKFGFGISNTGYESVRRINLSNQTDLSISYSIKLGKKLTLIPALQVSYIEKKQYYRNLYYLDPRIDYILPFDPDKANTKRSAVISPGFLLDINKKITFGAAFYNINQPDMGINAKDEVLFSQVYHLSMVLLKEKMISLQPYSILKLPNIHQYYYEMGAYTTFKKTITLQTAVKKGFYTRYLPEFATDNEIYLIAGLSVNYKKIRLGYTVVGGSGFEKAIQELFLSANLFNKGQKQNYNLVLN